jgi:anti-anti-sigma factor
MLELTYSGDNRVLLAGRFDASQVEKARSFLNVIEGDCTLDFGGLEYISSAGLGVLLAVQKRLGESGHSLKLVNMDPHTRDIFRIAGLDMIFEIE